MKSEDDFGDFAAGIFGAFTLLILWLIAPLTITLFMAGLSGFSWWVNRKRADGSKTAPEV